MRTALRSARSILRNDISAHQNSIPTFLCPVLLRNPLVASFTNAHHSLKDFSSLTRHGQHTAVVADHFSETTATLVQSVQDRAVHPTLPRACPGCGAPAQVFDKSEAGFYDIDRRQVKAFLNYEPQKAQEASNEDEVYAETLKTVDSNLLAELGLDHERFDDTKQSEAQVPATPVCERCHNLVHHNTGTPIQHPSVDAIQQTIAESPHRRNHIYHVLDAADFPLSLIPNLQSSLRLPKLRTQNRRAKHKGWVANNRIAEVSFIITRADLLAPLKEQVDNLMPYIQEVLRNALGRVNRQARLGNVRLVSAKRGWWTKQVKEDIWGRGGAGWMVGKVNVGKSNLFEVVFPKGRGADYEDLRKIRIAAEREAMLQNTKTLEERREVRQQFAAEDARVEQNKSDPHAHTLEPEDFLDFKEEDDYDPDSLLPPPQPYTPYPVLPLASSLPGTTASPIRVPFGSNRGELVDLPGLARTNPELTTFVKPSEHDQLVMKHRIAPEKHVLRPGKSLVLGGGLVRITPTTEELVFLIHAFVPLTPHVTSTEKAISLQDQSRESGVPSILAPNTGRQMKSAGRFQLRWDVTKKLAGPLTSAIAGKMKPENLPFRIYSTDILIEGVGWIEVSAQVRKPRGWKPIGMAKKDPNHAQVAKSKKMEELKRLRDAKFVGDALDRAGLSGGHEDTSGLDAFDDVVDDGEGEQFPEIEVFSPLGKYIGARMPMCGSVLGGPKPVSSRERKARPRRSMVSVKRQRRSAGGG